MRKALVSLLLLAASVASADGPPYEYGPTDPHQIDPVGANQPVLVIYVQANDYRIPAAQLAALNTAEDQKRTQFPTWFAEASWNKLSMVVTGQRAAGGQWYTLPEGLLEYVSPGGVRAMQVRAPGTETTMNPTPAASVTASAGGSGSNFTAADAGNYWYAVTGFRNGSESQLTKLGAAVAIAAALR